MLLANYYTHRKQRYLHSPSFGIVWLPLDHSGPAKQCQLSNMSNGATTSNSGDAVTCQSCPSFERATVMFSSAPGRQDVVQHGPTKYSRERRQRVNLSKDLLRVVSFTSKTCQVLINYKTLVMLACLVPDHQHSEATWTKFYRLRMASIAWSHLA